MAPLEPPPRGFHVTPLDIAVLGVIFGLGLAHLGSPFAGDQFLFLVGAQKIAHHGVMYRDFWDLKQPLIYYVYCFAGLLFGFTERGIHLFEAAYQTLFAGVLIVSTAARFRPRWAASIVPLLTIGAYDAFASNYALTSVEALAGLPIFAAAALAAQACAAPRNGGRLALAAGVAGALAAAFKAVFFPLVAALWLTALAATVRANGLRRTARTAVLLGVGSALPPALIAAYFAAAGVLDVALQTAFIDPPKILRHLARADSSPFWPEARFFGRMVWPLVALTVAGAATLRRNTDVLVLQMVVWTLLGCLLIALQVWSYEYRFYIIIVPVGVLAARGWGEIWSAIRTRKPWLRAGFVLVLCIMLAAAAQSALRMQGRWNGWARDNALAAASSVPFLKRADARPGPIYIFGDPRLYYYSGRDQAVAINGWSPQLLVPAQWHELHAELAAAAPPYIMIENDFVPRLQHSPEILRFIAAEYRPAFTARDGRWYEHR